MEDILRMEHITKCFGEVFANKDVNLNVHQGEVHTLLGENGAGKSTLMSILAGLYQPTYGKIWYKGKEVKLDSPKTAVNMGIGMVYQHFMLIENMTVLDNIILGTSAGHSPVINRKMLRKTITELAEKYGLELEFDQKIKNISVGAQQRVEILKALYRNADLLILDEPTAALTDSEVDSLFDIIRRLVKENKSVIFISHKMKEVMTISDRITVLRDGRTVKTLKRSETTGTFLADLMTGREVKESVYEKHTDMKENAFEIRNVSYQPNVRHGGLNNISLAVRKGEILGVAGVDGNG